ncbi:SUN domain-containing protein 1 [Liparis tanakae]|uniref:SUN domain-containing protein 1 n=1 Tax=Liparis tanakae TaxID=230148 RepID=A0A4Z2EZN6_9TELE|nr:SUN domain-containing protein 1 [Liparis tanakae]
MDLQDSRVQLDLQDSRVQLDLQDSRVQLAAVDSVLRGQVEDLVLRVQDLEAQNAKLSQAPPAPCPETSRDQLTPELQQAMEAWLKKPSGEVHRCVELRVLSNWGHVLYTCLYRFRVHGKIAATP